MIDFEKLGLFYLGRRHDLVTGKTLDEPVLYDSRDLVTHAVCVGMTGSGKTGLCIDLVEEAVIDGVPVVAIDPKGDLGNLLLTFPGLTAAEFRPWVDEDGARRAGMSLDEYAAQQAEMWQKGIAAWGQDRSRIDRLRKSAEFSLFTPGSRSGLPVSILRSFAAPPPEQRHDTDALVELASGTAGSALVLVGMEAAPGTREHTLVARLLSDAWQRGNDLDLAGLIRQVQSPPFDKLGIMDLESFFPARDRFELAMQLNGVLAAPGFERWLEGEALDPSTLLYTADGRPRVSVFSIAHLGDTERMFFVSLLLNQLVSWMRRQSGTQSLRAIVYMDEILGYLPPVANPPSKPPLMTLLKQGRAFGLGVVLATQNPVDLDYKGLSNTGTWFLGRLQTERDKARVLEGLQGAAGGLNRAEADRILSALKPRLFLMHNVHDTAPTVFESRWTLSYLRGPLSRDHIKALNIGTSSAPTSHTSPGSPPQPLPAAEFASASGGNRGGRQTERPVLPPGIQEFFLPAAGHTEGGAVYRPAVIGAARVSFTDRPLGVDSTRDVFYIAPVTDGAVQVDWSEAKKVDITADDLLRHPGSADVVYESLPAAAAQPRNYAIWNKSFSRWLAQNESMEVLRHRTLSVVSRPGESERDFRIRLQLEARSARDEAVDAVRKKYAGKEAALNERLKRAQAMVAREQQQVSDSRLQTAVSMGATVLGALLGRRAVTAGSLGRATTAARGVGRTMKEASDVKRAEESVETVRAAIAKLEEQIEADAAAVARRFEPDAPLERVVVLPKRGQVEVRFIALAWVPSSR